MKNWKQKIKKLQQKKLMINLTCQVFRNNHKNMNQRKLHAGGSFLSITQINIVQILQH